MSTPPRAPRRESEITTGLRRGLGSTVLFGLVQGFIAAALYATLGLVAERAGGLTWVVYLVAAAFFALCVLSYVEGASLHQERGGATVIARYAFNELWSFVAGWAILLDYLILIALTAFAASDYAGVMWDGFRDGVPEVGLSIVLLGIVAWANVRGFGPLKFERIAYLAIADLAVQVVLVALGVALLFEPEVLTDPVAFAGSPGFEDVLWAFPLAAAAFAGLDASSGFAGEVAIGRRGLRRLVSVRLAAVLVPYFGIAVVATSALSAGAPDIDAPLLGVADAFESQTLRDVLRYVIAASALGVLFLTCMAAMLGLSRLGYSLALNRQIPSAIGRLHPRYATPMTIILIATALAVILLIADDVEFLAGIVAFGATLSLTLVHLAVCVLRYREPDRDRPFRMPFNVQVAGGSLPLPAALGAVMALVAFGSVIALHTAARWVGLGWMAFGVVLYVYYRRSEHKSLYRRVTVPEATLTQRGIAGVEYGTILVPILGTPLDDDIVQTAGRLAAEEREDEGEQGAEIEAMWPFVVPMSLPLDARLPESELKRARAALARAKAVGEEYDGVTVKPFTVRARSAGQAIVREAKRRGAEVIVLAAEEPTRMRGGLVLGGKEGLHDTFVGETTRYVLQRASCRVVLTAPPDRPD